jgi:hypothetical protein
VVTGKRWEEVSTMEGILYELEALVSPWAVIGGVSLLAVGVAVMLLGRASDEEATGASFHFAEPIPGSEEVSAEEETFRLAA